MLQLFFQNLAPIFLVAAVGYVLVARSRIDPAPLARLAFMVLAPCFVYETLTASRTPLIEMGRIAGLAMSVSLMLAGVALAVSRLLGWERKLCTVAVLGAMLPNAGNYGISASRFAFGEEAVAHAGVFFVASAVMTFTAGILVASWGQASLRDALGRLPRVPAIWALVAAFLALGTGFELPLPVDRGVELLSDATIPMFLLILGMQLHGKGLTGPWGPVGLAIGLRLLGSIAIAWPLSSFYGLEGVARQTAVLQSGMPAAVIAIVIAAEYDVEPAVLTTIVVLGTLLSPLTLTPLLSFLGT